MSASESFPIEVGSKTHVGRVRGNNEDSCGLLPEINLYIVSDGMGGETHGELASALAIESIAAHCREASSNASTPFYGALSLHLWERTDRLVSAVHFANQTIYEVACRNAQLRRMGATVVAAWLDGPHLSLAHVGDSRAYLVRAESLEQLTSDHSLVAEQVRRGVLTPEQARKSSMQNVLTRALGTQGNVEVDAKERTLLKGDGLLLCSDGLTQMVPDPEIASTLSHSPDVQTASDRLVDLANQHGGEDNVTVIVLRFGGKC